MLETRHLPLLGFGAFSIFAVLAGLVLLVGANHASPGCTGPAVVRCDYVATARIAVSQTEHHSFQPDLGFEVFDQGSAVLIQQYTPPGEPTLNHAPSVLIDKKSCRACAVDWQVPITGDPRDPPLGPVISRIAPEDPIAAEERAKRWEGGSGGVALL